MARSKTRTAKPAALNRARAVFYELGDRRHAAEIQEAQGPTKPKLPKLPNVESAKGGGGTDPETIALIAKLEAELEILLIEIFRLYDLQKTVKTNQEWEGLNERILDIRVEARAFQERINELANQWFN